MSAEADSPPAGTERGRRLAGYALVVLAATFWGGSAVCSKFLYRHVQADALLLSQARVTISWLLLAAVLAIRSPGRLRIRLDDAWRFVLLGLFGVAGSNFFLYYSFQTGMDTAIADLIQFTAPVIVALWAWWRRTEPMDARKAVALVLTMAGCTLALGALRANYAGISAVGAASAATSMLCYAFLIVWGKDLAHRYSTSTYLHYGLMTAAVLWCFVQPPWVFARRIAAPRTALLLALFSIGSVLVPYTCFFLGLKRVAASRAAIVSTWEPVFITIAAWALLSETLVVSQLVGIGMVVVAIAIVGLASDGGNAGDEEAPDYAAR